MPGDTLEPGFRGVVFSKGPARGRWRDVGSGGEARRETKNEYANNQSGDGCQAQSNEIPVDGSDLNVAFLKGNVGVVRVAA